MTSFRKILFAGTLIPTIALTPLTGAFAQVPDHERGGSGGAHPDHGMQHERGPGGLGAGAGGPGEHMRGAGGPAAGAGATHHETAQGARGGEPGAAAHNPTAPHERAARIPAAREAAPRDTANEEPTHHATPNGAAATATERHTAPNAAAAPPHGTAERAAPRDAGAPTAPTRGTAERGTPQEQRSPANAARDDRHALPGIATPNRGTATRDTPTLPQRNQAQENQSPRNPDPRARDNAARTAPDAATQGSAQRNAPNQDPRTNAQRENAPNQPGTNGNRAYGNNGGDRGHGGISPGGAAAIGAAAGFAGGFLAATAGAQRLDDIRRDRREVVEDGRTYIREPGRTIVEDNGRSFVVHDENDRFRELGYDVRRERHGSDYVDVIDRPGGYRILTYTDASGRMLRRIRRGPDGREIVLIDNAYDGGIRPYDQDVVDLPPPPMRIPRDRYIVDYADADEGLIYDTLEAPPLAPPPQRYTLDQIRYSPAVRNYVRSVDINTINFDTGSWIVPGTATGKLQALAGAIKRAVGRNPNSVFLVEGYTDATGNPTDNLSLSDRRAQSVAAILTKDFNVPPENLTTQGYGQQNLKVNTPGPSAENRRVVVRNITQLLASNDQRLPSGE